jgi:hypothetical protein
MRLRMSEMSDGTYVLVAGEDDSLEVMSKPMSKEQARDIMASLRRVFCYVDGPDANQWDAPGFDAAKGER